MSPVYANPACARGKRWLTPRVTICALYRSTQARGIDYITLQQHLFDFHTFLQSILSFQLSTKMSTFHFSQVDEHLQKRIVKKFTFCSGTKYYRSSRQAKELVELLKPAWSLPDSSLSYSSGRRTAEGKVAVIGRRGIVYRRRNLPEKVFLKYCRIERILVEKCDDDYVKTVVLPDVGASVGILRIEPGMSEEHLRQLCSATKPETVRLDVNMCMMFLDSFKHVRNVYVDVNSDTDYLRTEKLFEIARIKKTITSDARHSTKTGPVRRKSFGQSFELRTPAGWMLERGGERLQISYELGRPSRAQFHFSTTTFDLNKVDMCSLTQILKKFNLRSGGNFYQSCKWARDTVDRATAVWELPNTGLYYRNQTRKTVLKQDGVFRTSSVKFSADSLCRIAAVYLRPCEQTFFKEVVLPEVAALGAVAVETLALNGCS